MHHLAFVPPAMDVSNIIYSAEQSWGFGPGGNETGIIVYEMPPATRRRIETEGVGWLNTLAGSSGPWQGLYRDWHPTPYDSELSGAFDLWEVEENIVSEGCSKIGSGIVAYMDAYGYCIPFDPDIEALANRALSMPGSFYAFGRIGMLLLIPAENRIIYAYIG
jgi:hypothetical protein